MRGGAWVLSGLVAAVALLSMAGAGAGQAEDAFTRLAGKIPYFNYGDFLYQRPSRASFVVLQAGSLQPGDPQVDAGGDSLKEAMAIPADAAELSGLLGHTDPKVRTLAMMRLYTLEQPESLPAIHALVEDAAPTFPDRPYTGDITFGEKVPVYTEDRTVGYLAAHMMKMAGFPAPWNSGLKNEDFQKWSQARIGNPDWIGWYDFLYRLASGGTMPVQKESAAKIQKLRDLMATRPPAVRTWFWFGIADDALSTPLYDTEMATEAEMIAAGKQLGADALLAFLRDGSRAGLRDPRLEDPSRGRRFVLSHAKQFFQPADAAALKEMGLLVAAADADPVNASSLIRERLAVATEWDQSLAIAALVDARGDAESEFVVKWFYDAPVQNSRSSDQGVFLNELTRRRPAQWRQTVRALVANPGFEKLGELDVLNTARLLNRLGSTEVVKQELFVSGKAAEVRNLLRRHFELPVVSYQRLEPLPSPAGKTLWSTGLDSKPHSLAVSPDGKTVAVGLDKGGVRLFDAANGAVAGSLAQESPRAFVRFGKAGDRLLVFDDNGLLSVWSLPDRAVIFKVPMDVSGWRDCDINDSVGLIATRGAPKNVSGISVWESPGGKLRWTHKMPVRGGGVIALSPDGQRLVAADSFTNDLHLFDPQSSTPLARMGHSDVPLSAVFSPDNQWLVSADEEMVRVWDGRTGAAHREYLAPSCGYYLAVTADSKCFITLSESNQLTQFEISTGKAVAGFAIPLTTIYNIQPAKDGKRIFMTLSGADTMDRGEVRPPARLICLE
ncbi:MAG: hypothetical protein EOP88_04245 [Verrucomicrobiaceae bacterium]|nr:MAG: hypothetical protein EOP88_04245 [Verrucomicrobiaceae bacterium]